MLSGAFDICRRRLLPLCRDFPARYVADLTDRPKLTRKLKVVAACGNGTAGAFAPRLLGSAWLRGHPARCELDFTFPRYNPEPRRPRNAARHGAKVRETAPTSRSASTATATAAASSTTRATRSSPTRSASCSRGTSPNSTQTRPSSSTSSRPGLFATDPELLARGVKADYWKTGHSHIKRRVSDLGALAGFEKSGHFFFNAPVGRGYDDGLVTAIHVLDMLDRNPGKSMSELYRALPKTWGSPTMSPHCDDEKKYGVVEKRVKRFEAMQREGATLTGRKSAISSPSTACASRSKTEPGDLCAHPRTSRSSSSSSKARSSEARMREMFAAIDGILRENPEVGAYNQTI